MNLITSPNPITQSCDNFVTRRLKAGIMGHIDVAIVMQWCGKHISVATDTDATIEDAV
jgi:hypothetical protein